MLHCLKASQSLLLLSLASPLVLACSKKTSTGAAAPPPSESPEVVERQQLQPAQIVYAMGSDVEEYRKCFMRAFRSPGLVETRFDIDHRGVVEDVTVVRSTIDKVYVPECLKERLLQQRFGELGSPSHGSWTFVYRLTEKIDEDEREALLERHAKERHGPAIAIAPESSGQLHPGDIEDATLAGYPLYAHCYRDSIQRRGESRGILSLRLSIDEQGRLTNIEDAGSILPDPFAVDCIAEAFYALEFPAPQGGRVEANYRLELE